MDRLPDGLTRFARSPEFTEQSIPQGLQSSHTIQANIWGMIVVLEGRLLYRILEPDVQEVELCPARPGFVEPEIAHEGGGDR